MPRHWGDQHYETKNENYSNQWTGQYMSWPWPYELIVIGWREESWLTQSSVRCTGPNTISDVFYSCESFTCSAHSSKHLILVQSHVVVKERRNDLCGKCVLLLKIHRKNLCYFTRWHCSHKRAVCSPGIFSFVPLSPTPKLIHDNGNDSWNICSVELLLFCCRKLCHKWRRRKKGSKHQLGWCD